MCCKRDDELTAKYRRKRKPFAAWRHYYVADGELCSRRNRQGGIVRGHGHIVSDRGTPCAKPDCGGFVFSGIHWFLTKGAALEDMSGVGGHAVVKVMVNPKDVVAVGKFWMNEMGQKVSDFQHNECLDVPVGVSTKVAISKKEFEKAVGCRGL